MRRSVLKKAKFDIMELDTIKVARRCFVPLLLGHAVDDDFIQPHHSDRIFDAYMGEKNIIKFDGDHNSQRPQFYFDSISIFFNNVLQPPDDDTFFDIPPDYFGKVCSLHEVKYSDDLLTSPIVLSSTEDTSKQIHAQRPISSTQQDVVAYPAPSSSNLISFELSNGNPCGPGVLASIDDDEYVEYSLDNLADFSESMEDENKMIMEAVKESLKDLETRTSHAEELSSSTKQPESLSEQLVPLNESPTTPIVTNGHDSASELQVADTNETSAGSPNLIPSANESENSGVSADSNISVDNPSIDLVDHTKVTMTVIKNPTTNIMNGLLRRWDLNFFRNR
nr:uncharacterized protein LOC109175893 isoform X1 [Ipomoea batatas]GME16596.1 uncharacterized protein LOC109175893 isoform X1 [Ipomoea batatas]